MEWNDIIATPPHASNPTVPTVLPSWVEEETLTLLTAIVMCNYHKLRARSSFAFGGLIDGRRNAARRRRKEFFWLSCRPIPECLTKRLIIYTKPTHDYQRSLWHYTFVNWKLRFMINFAEVVRTIVEWLEVTIDVHHQFIMRRECRLDHIVNALESS